jgi:hypothetical protein
MKIGVQSKYFQIYLKKEESLSAEIFPPSNTIINFKIHRPKGVSLWYLPWFEYVVDLWRYLGVPVDDNMLRHLYPAENLEALGRNFYNNYLMSMAIATILFVIALLFIYRDLIFSVGFFSLIVFFFFIIILPYRKKSHHYKIMLKQLYPNR